MSARHLVLYFSRFRYKRSYSIGSLLRRVFFSFFKMGFLLWDYVTNIQEESKGILKKEKIELPAEEATQYVKAVIISRRRVGEIFALCTVMNAISLVIWSYISLLQLVKTTSEKMKKKIRMEKHVFFWHWFPWKLSW